MKVLLVNDTEERGNIGCQLTSRTFSSLLQRQGFDIVPAPWRFASRLKTEDRRLWSGFNSEGLLSEPLLRMLASVEYGTEALRAAQTLDLVVFQPEGTISDQHGALRIFRNLSLALWCGLYGDVPLVVANGTFPLFTDHRAALIRQLLAAADLAVLRDRISAQHWGVPCAPDSALLWNGKPVRESADRLLVTTAAECSAEVDLAIGEAALNVAEATGLRPLVLTKAWQRFEPIRHRIEAAKGTFAAPTTTLDEADTAITHCRLHVGGRYHMALLCATKGIPSALVRSNTHKNVWLAKEFSGIDLAERPQDLLRGAMRLPTQIPYSPLVADVARCRTEVLQVLERLDLVRRNAKSAWTAPEGLVAQLRQEARRDRWRGAIKSLVRRT